LRLHRVDWRSGDDGCERACIGPNFHHGLFPPWVHRIGLPSDWTVVLRPARGDPSAAEALVSGVSSAANFMFRCVPRFV
jgi:hypothetical protein